MSHIQVGIFNNYNEDESLGWSAVRVSHRAGHSSTGGRATARDRSRGQVRQAGGVARRWGRESQGACGQGQDKGGT